MRPFADPDILTPDERFARVAGILAAGLLRLHTRAALSVNTAEHSGPKNPVEMVSSGLEVPDETVLSVHNG